MGFLATLPDLCTFEVKCFVCLGCKVSDWRLGRVIFLSFLPFLSFHFFSFLGYQ